MGYVLLQIQISQGKSRYCQEAVDNAESVGSCPTSKEEWEIAARKKNCSKIASKQNCSSVEKFQYHCVINGMRNTLVEVCAPTRIIFGYCVEFNVLGGVIQDQRSAPCNKTFPKCDNIYLSSDAYKYPDCFELVSISEDRSSTKKIPLATKKKTANEPVFLKPIAITIGFLSLAFISIFAVTNVQLRKRRQRARKKIDENNEAMLNDDDSKQS